MPDETSSDALDDVAKSLSQLTVKEFEVLRLFASGMAVGEIAQSLNRSIKTISTLKISAMRKLDVDNDQALLILCLKANLFT